jgi:hypothetical protein
MSFQKTIAQQVANTAALLTVLKTQLTNMGWVDHDDQIAGSDYFVVYSDGEGKCPVRVYIQVTTSGLTNQMQLKRWAYWDNVGHSGTFDMSDLTNMRFTTDDDAPFYVWIYGNMDSIAVITLVASTYDGSYIHRFYPVFNALGRLQNSESTGTDKWIELGAGQADNFDVGAGVTFWDAQNGSHAGRNHRSLITAVDPSGSRIKVDQLYLAMQADALVGYCVDFHTQGGSDNVIAGNLQADLYTDSGTVAVDFSGNLQEVISTTNLDPDTNSGVADRGPSNLFLSVPYYLKRDLNGFLGFQSGIFSKSPYASGQYEDTVAIGLLTETFNASGGSTNTIGTSATNWGTSQYVGKACIIVQNTGAGQIRRITSHGTGTLTVSGNWSTTPDSTSKFIIARGGARHFGWSNAQKLFQEVPAPPTHPADNT